MAAHPMTKNFKESAIMFDRLALRLWTNRDQLNGHDEAVLRRAIRFIQQTLELMEITADALKNERHPKGGHTND